MKETFFTTVGCADGRSQQAAILWGQTHFNARYADVIAEPGLVGKIKDLEQIRDGLLWLFEKHNSRGIIVHGHQECIANPVDDIEHMEQIKKVTSDLHTLGLAIIPLFVVRMKDSWKGRVI